MDGGAGERLRGGTVMNRSLLFASVSLLAALPAAAQPFGRTLTPEEVACEERQLNRLVRRAIMSVGGSAFDTNLFLWRGSASGGIYPGLASFGALGRDISGRVRIEEQVAFGLIFKQEEDFLSPSRRLLPQATLVRRDAASNLHPADAEIPYIWVGFDLAPVLADSGEIRLPIKITSRRAAGEGQSDRAGRGLVTADLLSVCHQEVTPFDLRVFSILARTVRASECLGQPFGCSVGPLPHKSVIFRGEEPLSYRINTFTYSSSCDDEDNCSYGEADTALLFHLQVDAAGRLTIGDVQALPFCQGGPIEDQIGCTQSQNPLLGIYVLPPIRPGAGRQGEPEFQRAAFLNVVSVTSEDFNILQVDVNWADLLRDSSWNQGFDWAAAPVNVCSAEP